MYYRGAGIAIVGFDVTNLSSLAACDYWIKELNEANKCGFNGVIVAVGNKIDLVDRRKISTEEARQHFETTNPPIPYFETSALTGEGVTELFQGAVSLWLERLNNSQMNPNDNESNHGGESKGKCIVC